MLSSATFLGLLVAALQVSSSLAQTCKCLPGDDCFPSAEEWAALSDTLSSPLIVDQRPIGSTCYQGSPNFNADVCAQSFVDHSSSSFLSFNPATLQYYNNEAIITDTEVIQCDFDPSVNGTCYQGRVPPYVVVVSTVEDIQNAIVFATEHNLKLVVKNTGHEFLGRAFGIGALELFTHNLQDTEWVDSFVPAGAPEGTEGIPAVTLAPGVIWDTVYREAQEHGVSVAGGWAVDGSVGAAAGWPLGGGHSVISAYYGLGVDNILELDVVLPNASFVTVSEYSYPDLFWGLRGGGGPNFGVVTSLTYRTHPNPPYTAYFYSALADSKDAFVSLLTVWMEYHNPVNDAGWGGVWPYFSNQLHLTMATQGPTPEDSPKLQFWKDFVAASSAIPGVNVTVDLVVEYPDFYQYYFDNLVDSSRGHGINYTALVASGSRASSSSWLMPRDTTSPETAVQMGSLLSNITVGIGFMDMGGVVADVPEYAMALNPAFRRSISDLTISLPWTATSTAQEINAVLQQLTNELQLIKNTSPPPYGGQYVNEPDPLEANWAAASWGDNYPRLLALKKEVDPNDLFVVRQGPNSEGWDNEIICKS